MNGRLTTFMGLTANRRPFVYVPLQHHWAQLSMRTIVCSGTAPGPDWTYSDATDPDAVAKVIADELGSVVDYRSVATGGVARAVASIAELI